MRRKSLVLILTLVAALMLCVPAFAQEEAAEPAALKVGDMLPDDLKAANLDGSAVSLKKAISSKPYTFFQFMTTACSACQAELNAFINMQVEMPDKFDIVAISMDILGADAVNAYESRNKYGIKYLLDQEFSLPPRFDFPYTPSFFIADSSGKVVFMKGGYMSSRWPRLQKQIMGVLN